ncbi:hydrogenase maturation nickel metallochaperone HypA [bacterium]|nr:hydrogenase maturation nickel metallochaperone HypA [bacterium]
MHETAIAMSIVETVLTEAEKQQAVSVQSIDIEIGELTFLGTDQIAFWVKTNFENTIAANAALNFIQVKAEVSCDACGYRGGLSITEDPAYHMQLPVFACPHCGRGTITIIKGKDAFIRTIHIEKE